MLTVVRLDTPKPEIASLAQELSRWLLDKRVIQGNSRRDKLWQPSEWMPGPRWRDVVKDHPSNQYFATSANNGVDVEVKRDVYHPLENYEPPVCVRCGAALLEDAHHAMIEPWLAGPEPVAVCAKCGWSALIGDWPAGGGFAIGAPAVVFNNWPILRSDFLADLRSALRGRTYVVRTYT